jgi:hypothetical protein
MSENKKPLTIFQSLTKTLYDMGGNPIPPKAAPQEKIIIQGDSMADLHAKQQELLQQEVLRQKFYKVEERGYLKSLQFEAGRLQAYIDYEGMEYYPIIASALDLYMEEATTIGENGRMLNIYSRNERVKGILEDLFYGIINVNANLPAWVRNLPVKHDSVIPMLDGTFITIKDLSDEMKNNPNKEFWTYSIKEETKDIVPGKIVWCDLTRKDSTIYKIKLDDNTYVETTGDHEFLLRSGKRIKASDLKAGDSLMPFYTRISKDMDKVIGYEKVYNPMSDHYKYTHYVVAHNIHRNLEYEKSVGEIFDTHHVNFNKLDNSPSNLQRLTRSEHFKIHQEIAIRNLHTPEITKKRLEGIDKYLRSDERKINQSNRMKGVYNDTCRNYNNSELHSQHNIIRKESMLNCWSDPEYKTKTSSLMRIYISDFGLDVINNYIHNSKSYISRKQMCELLKNNSEFVDDFKLNNLHIKRDVFKSLNSRTLEILIHRKTNFSYLDYYSKLLPSILFDKNYISAKNISNTKIKANKKLLNHKVVSIEILNDLHDVYCMEVVGPNNEEDRHNFPICSKDDNGNFTRNGVFVSNCKYGDNFTYAYSERKKGIVSVKQMVNYDIQRYEKEVDGKFKIYFKNRTTGDEYGLMEIGHFRLLGDDKFIPHGSSILNKVRGTFRRLVLAEDAMVTYRLIRAGEKRVFKVDVGNINPNDVEAYIQKIANNLKRKVQIDRNNGQIDYRFNILGNDEDIFIPTRNGNSGNVVETLQGGQSLDQIADIGFLRDNLFTGLGVPKPFLSFDGTAGAGKNMAQFDMRFAKKINRIQQAVIQELNKLAIIHLYMLGFHDELNNFSLSLTNPSTQGDILKIELWKERIQLYKDMTSAEGGGIAPVSHTYAKKHILNWSDKEIFEDLQNQKIERVISQELQDAITIIPKSGVFDKLDAKFAQTDGLVGNDGSKNELPTDEPKGLEPNNPDDGGQPQQNNPNTPEESIKSFDNILTEYKKVIGGENEKRDLGMSFYEKNEDHIHQYNKILNEIKEIKPKKKKL